ncbi:MAG TPA: glycosyltransferase [Planctomycetaceae bacterium]|nr:glycosyltransferase [Planctomycetaceae bacterium]
MSRFILADQSLVNTGGHHYEFAHNVLSAARERGDTPVLASHRDSPLTHCGPWPVRPTYRDGLWTHQAGNRGLKGLSYAVSALRRGGWFAEPLAELAARGRDVWRASRFAGDTRRLLQALAVTAGDLVFIPNATLTEVFAITQLLHDFPAARRASWHLEFHIHIFPRGARHSAAKFSAARELQAALHELRNAAESARLCLYTDTDELTEQYRTLKAGSFATLPIPVDPIYRPAANDASRNPHTPLRFAYVGDARVEKGYPQLPEMIRSVWSELVASGRVQFVIQSNCRNARSERASLAAREELAALGAPQVQLLTEPLSTADYRSLVLDSDVLLLPYDPESYEARSSGILSEALAAGKPVVVPQGTWMARQVPDNVGVVYPAGPAGMAEAVRRMAADFDDFRFAARVFSSEWSQRHDPRRLVACLRQSAPLSAPHFTLRQAAVSDT